MLSRLRAAGETFVERHLQGEALSLSFEIPGHSGPLWRFRLDAESGPRADGKHVKLRAHWRLSLRRATGVPVSSRTRGLPARVGRWIERRLDTRLLQAIADPVLDRDLSSWLEVNASNAALDEGSKALVPQRLAALGIEPRDDAPIQTWAGATASPRPGFAALTLLQLDKKNLPRRAQRALGSKPFQLTAAFVNVVEDV